MAAVKKASEQLQDEHSPEPVVDVSDAPPLRPIVTLRMAQRKGVLKLAAEANEMGDDVDADTVLDLVDKIDQELERLAVNPEAYAAWAVGDNLEARILALFGEYAAPLGDSTRSAN